MQDPTGRSGQHPDLRELILVTSNGEGYPHPGMMRPITMDRLEIAWQRTWHGIRSHRAFFDGSSFSACQVRIQNEPHPHSLFIKAMQRPGDVEWGFRRRTPAASRWPTAPRRWDLDWGTFTSAQVD